MNAMEIQYDFLADNSPLGLLSQKFDSLYASSGKVRRGCFAQIGEVKKENMELKNEIKSLKDDLESIKKFIGMKNEETNFDDMPLLQLLERVC